MNSQNKVYALLVEPNQKPKITHIEVNEQAIKNAVGGAVNSASAGIKAKRNSGILKIVLPIAAVVIVILAVVLNIHTCEECGDVYFGKKNTISFWGESESVCKDCYNDFYMW